MGDRLLGQKRYAPYKDPLVIFCIIIAFLLVCIGLFTTRYVGIYVNGSSMSPTLTGAPESSSGEAMPGGDYLYADTYALPDRGDIVVVLPENTSRYIIKRVIALGGDEIYMSRGVVYLKTAGTEQFFALEEDYVLDEQNDPDLPYNSYRSEDDPLVVPEGHMFVLGDNRGYRDGNEIIFSNDSRRYGTFSYDSLVGVIADWSLAMKGFFSPIYNFLRFGIY